MTDTTTAFNEEAFYAGLEEAGLLGGPNIAASGTHKGSDETTEPRSFVRRVSDVEPEKTEWLWGSWLPLGKLAVIDGDPGDGKSTITCDLAARVTTGTPFPDGSVPGITGAVLILSAEDGAGDTIRPRLAAAGADLEQVYVLDAVEGDDGLPRPPEVPGDIPLIERVIREHGIVLVVVDPLNAFLPVAVDAYKDQHVRRALHPLAMLAERAGATVLVVRHLNKTSTGKAIYRGGGSIGIIGAARVGMLVAPEPSDDEDDTGRRVLCVVKSNLAARPDALAYRIVGDELHDCARVAWDGTSSFTADQLVSVRAQDHGEREEAKAYLEAELAGGPRPVSDVEPYALRRWSKSTVWRAKKDLDVESYHEGYGAEVKWYWRLRSSALISPPDHLSGNPHGNRDSAPPDSLRWSAQKERGPEHLSEPLPLGAHPEPLSDEGGESDPDASLEDRVSKALHAPPSDEQLRHLNQTLDAISKKRGR